MIFISIAVFILIKNERNETTLDIRILFLLLPVLIVLSYAIKNITIHYASETLTLGKLLNYKF